MPRQVSMGRTPFTSASKSSAQKAKRKHKQRGLDAFAIATAENPDSNGIKRHRMGETEQSEEPKAKKRRSGEDENVNGDNSDMGDHSEQDLRDQRRLKQRVPDEEGLDNSGGSDSEGNEWRMGQVSDDEDEELDSDEAFGESDEERFEGFTFRGSSSTKKKPTRNHASVRSVLDLNEQEEAESQESDENSLGEDAVDLATMLDQDQDDVDDIGSEEAEGSGDESPSFSSEDEVDSDNEDRLQKLQDLVSSLPHHTEGYSEAENVGDPQVSRERLLGALRGMSNLDPAFSRSAKRLANSTTDSSKTGRPSSLVKVPLPKRQQDRIDREAAYVKAKETLNRWIDTVKHNRRAEHLSFPLKDPQAQEAQGTTRMIPAGEVGESQNELERAIHTIMQESGLQPAHGATDSEAHIREAEDLQTKEMPVEEVMARRAELRKQRDLLFREEIRARRIKKIKSKAYRRVHRKEKEKSAQKERDLLAAAGLDDSEEERERNDRRRAEERMSARHRESKWAKGIKKSGRSAWDDDARTGVTDLARRNEDLRKRLEGRKVHGSDDDSASLSNDNDDEDSDDDGHGSFKLKNALDNLGGNEPEVKSRLGSMKFMQRADAARKKQNDDAVAVLRKAMENGSENEGDSEEERQITGRRTYGPPLMTSNASQPTIRRNDLEEGDASESDSEPSKSMANAAVTKQTASSADVKAPQAVTAKTSTNTKSKKNKGVKSMQVTTMFSPTDDADPIKPADLVRDATASSNATAWERVQVKGSGPSEQPIEAVATNEIGDEQLMPSNLDLVRAAFGGDEDEATFEADKRALIADEDDKTVDNALPGWGSWVGEGMSKSQQKRNKPRKTPTIVQGTKAADRKDAKLSRVIISEKRMKKNAKYLTPSLPHPFESRQQYERSLRIPIGPEWSTKESFQAGTKPRVMVKQGIIKPMETPSI